MQDLNGEDQATASGNSQIEQLNQHINAYHHLSSKQFTVAGNVRDAQVGYWFELTTTQNSTSMTVLIKSS